MHISSYLCFSANISQGQIIFHDEVINIKATVYISAVTIISEPFEAFRRTLIVLESLIMVA